MIVTPACAGSKTGDRVSPDSTSERRGLAIAVVVCALIGAATVGATLTLSRGDGEKRVDAAAAIATEEYGRRLLTDTSRLMRRNLQQMESAARGIVGAPAVAPGHHTQLRLTERRKIFGPVHDVPRQ